MNLLNKSVPSRDQMPTAGDLRELHLADIATVLRRGWSDFVSFPTSAVMIALIYPVVGLSLARVLDGMSFLPLLFPLATGFALLGPLAAVFFYALSRRREAGGQGTSFSLIPSAQAWTALAIMGAFLLLIFLVWIAVARSIYNSTYGFAPAASMMDFARLVVTTPKGQLFLFEMIVAGLPFAAAAFAISVVSFPMIVDRNCGAIDAMLMSFRVLARSPATMAVWALTISVLLAAAMLPAFLGLAVVVPVLGHGTWHLYRRATG